MGELLERHNGAEPLADRVLEPVVVRVEVQQLDDEV